MTKYIVNEHVQSVINSTNKLTSKAKANKKRAIELANKAAGKLLVIANNGIPSCYDNMNGYFTDFWPDLPWNNTQVIAVMHILDNHADALTAFENEYKFPITEYFTDVVNNYSDDLDGLGEAEYNKYFSNKTYTMKRPIENDVPKRTTKKKIVKKVAKTQPEEKVTESLYNRKFTMEQVAKAINDCGLERGYKNGTGIKTVGGIPYYLDIGNGSLVFCYNNVSVNVYATASSNLAEQIRKVVKNITAMC